MEVIVRDAFSSSVFFRSFLENPSSISIPLPKGAYRVRANFFPAVGEKLLDVGLEEESSCVLKNPAQGKVKVKIINSKGEFVPGKVIFIGLSPTKTPYFKPENPVKSGRKWESSKNEERKKMGVFQKFLFSSKRREGSKIACRNLSSHCFKRAGIFRGQKGC
jgi:hypothetical protein